LSDGTDPYPPRARHELMSTSSDDRSPTHDENTLLELAGIGKARVLGPDFLASGNWSSPDSIRVDISTVLVPTDKVDLVAVAIGTSPEFHMWLPTVRAFEDEDEIYLGDDMAPYKEWVSRREASAKLDEFDLFGSIAAIRRSRLTMEINKSYALTSTDPWSATWSNTRQGHEIVYTAEAWGVHQGQGRSAITDQGNTITCRKDFLLEVLRKSDCSLLMLIKLELFIESGRFNTGEGSDGKFVFSWLTAIIDQSGNVRLVKPTDADRKVIESLHEHDHCDLNARFRALKESAAH
jgi:hypothetical protein